VLTRIEIDGFKTFKDFALDVPPFLVVLGQNAAGKSNLFDAIAFLSLLARGETVMQAVRESRGDLSELLHRDSAGRSVDQLRFAVELGALPRGFGVLLQVELTDLRYELDLGVQIGDPSDPWGTRSLEVTGERWLGADRSPAGSRSPWGDLGYKPIGETSNDERFGRRYPASRAFRSHAPLDDGVVRAALLDELVRAGQGEIASWRVLAFEPSSLRQTDGYDDENHLSESGAHLPNTLARIIRGTRTDERPEGALSDLTNDLATVIPEVVNLRVVDSKELRIRSLSVTDRGGGEFTSQAVSDGTLRALALITALKDPGQTGLLCVEEPENGVFPKRLGRLMELMGRATVGTSPRQVLVSSHSPAVLAALPPTVGRALRDDAIFLDSAALVLAEPGTFSRVTLAMPLRGDPSVPLPRGLPGPVMSAAEIDDFLGSVASR
jgi:predicted ATPase